MKRKQLIAIIVFIVIVIALIIISNFSKTQTSHVHSYGGAEITKEATCIEDGILTRVCSVCNTAVYDTLSAKGHSWGDWTTVKAATCTKDGYKQRSCFCGVTETKDISARGYHSYGEWKTTKAATCTTEGIQARACSCGESEVKVISGFAEHRYVCGVCSVCQKKINYIPLNTKQSSITFPTAPLKLMNSATTVELDSLTWKVDSSYIYITFSGTKTWFYFSSSHYVKFDFKLYDSQGYLIDTFSRTVRDLAVGDKFKDVTVEIPISVLEEQEDYIVKIEIHC